LEDSSTQNISYVVYSLVAITSRIIFAGSNPSGILRGQAMTILPDLVKVNKRATADAIPANQRAFFLAAWGLASYFGGAVEGLVLRE